MDTMFLRRHTPWFLKCLMGTLSWSVYNYNVCRMDVLNSPLWDEAYYVRNYSPLPRNLTAVDHFLKYGWKKGYNPSKNFITNDYLKQYPFVNVNPLVHYLEHGRFHYFTYAQHSLSPNDSAIIEDYWDKRQHRVSDKVVYTCITNDYDDITSMQHFTYFDFDWDYICFSDNPDLINQGRVGIWEIRPLAATIYGNTRNSRYHKMMPHRLFPEYAESIWIDANVNIVSSYLFDSINAFSEKDFMYPCMNYTRCMYDEIDRVLKMNSSDAGPLIEFRNQIKKEGFPKHYGLAETNILYRKHLIPELIVIMEEWWAHIEHCCRRDQTCLSYLLWKHGRRMEDGYLNNAYYDYLNFQVFPHKKERIY